MSAGRTHTDDTAPLRVLVVDDQPAFRTTVELVLRHTDGFELVASADSGEAALDIVSAGLGVDLAGQSHKLESLRRLRPLTFCRR